MICDASHVCVMRPILRDAATPPVVIVDDDADFVAILREGVRDAGYRPIWARDGRDALSAIMDQQPAAILVDVAMLASNGSNLLAILACSPTLSRIPRLIVTKGGTFATWDPASSPVLGTRVGLARLPKIIRRLAGPTARSHA
jgi:response regulator RpfG family c-di-GMP phosphodiesterase